MLGTWTLWVCKRMAQRCLAYFRGPGSIESLDNPLYNPYGLVKRMAIRLEPDPPLTG